MNEPSVVAISQIDKRILAVGADAKEMIGRTPEEIIAYRPMRDGVIADYRVTQAMLRYFIGKALGRFQFFKPEVMVSVPTGRVEVVTLTVPAEFTVPVPRVVPPLGRGGDELKIVADTKIEGHVRSNLPSVFHKKIEILVVEVVLTDAGHRVGHLHEGGVVTARQTVAQVDALNVRRPIAEVVCSGVGVDAASLKEIDEKFVD